MKTKDMQTTLNVGNHSINVYLNTNLDIHEIELRIHALKNLKRFGTKNNQNILFVDENKLTKDIIEQIRNYLKVKESTL